MWPDRRLKQKVQPIEKIGEICKGNNILFFVDACQTFGKLEINVKLKLF